jgi:hypothetical protein
MKNFLAMIRKSLLRYDFSLPLQPEADPIAADAREGCRGNPPVVAPEGRHGGLPLQFEPLPPMEGEEVIGDLPVQCHVWVI